MDPLLRSLSQRDCEKVAEGLEDAGIAATYYHAKLDADRREHVQRSWMQNKFKVSLRRGFSFS